MKYLSLACFILLGACYGKVPNKTGMEGREIPAFSILLMDSIKTINTHNIPDGTPFIVFIYGPNCPYSRAQAESFISYADELKQVPIYAITGAPFVLAREFTKKYELQKHNNIVSGVDSKDVLARYMAIPGVPFIAIYDKDKKLKGAFSGETDIKSILHLLND